MQAAPGGSAALGVSGAAAEALRILGASLLDDLDSLADRLALMILQREPRYGELGVPVHDDLRSACRANLERGIQSLSGAVPADTDPQDTSRETGRLRARQGVPLEAVLRSYRLGGRVIWEALLAASRQRFDGAYDEALLDAAGSVWRAIDGSSSALVDAYRLEESRARTRDLSRKHAFLNALIEGRGGDPTLVREASTALGMPEGSALLCVVAPVDSPREEPLRSPHDTLAAQGIVSCWAVRPQDIVGLVALGGRPESAVIEALQRCLSGRAGISPVLDGLAEAGSAYRMAQTAARTVSRTGLAALDDRLPEALLIDSPELVPRLLQVSLGGLLALPEPDRQTLLDTLDAVLAAGGSPTHAAQALYCHRNTVIYRLHRIETVTGRKVADPRDRLLLTLGLMASRIP